jgi:hypothetical protein
MASSRQENNSDHEVLMPQACGRCGMAVKVYQL